MEKLSIKWVPILRTTIQAACGVLVALITNLTKLVTDPVWSIVVGAGASILSCFLMNIQKNISTSSDDAPVDTENHEVIEEELDYTIEDFNNDSEEGEK